MRFGYSHQTQRVSSPIPISQSDVDDYSVKFKKDFGTNTYVFYGNYDNLVKFMTEYLEMSEMEADSMIGEQSDFDGGEDHFQKERNRIDDEWGSHEVDAAAARRSGSGRPFEGVSNKSLVEAFEEGEYYADYDDETGSYCVFDDLGIAVASFATPEEAKEEADRINRAPGDAFERERSRIAADWGRPSYAERSFEGVTSLKTLLSETNPITGEEHSGDNLDVCLGCGEIDCQCPTAGGAESCPSCGGLNTEWDEPVPSMMGYGSDHSMRCNDCNKSFAVDPFGDGFVKESQARPASDYEPCGDCGFDHGYEQDEAALWHQQHDPEGEFSTTHNGRRDRIGGPDDFTPGRNEWQAHRLPPVAPREPLGGAAADEWIRKHEKKEGFDKFMDKILVQESPVAQRPMLVEADSLQRVRAARHQERPAGRIVYRRLGR